MKYHGHRESMQRLSSILLAGIVLLLVGGTQMNAQDLERIGKEKPVRVSGSASVRAQYYGASGIEKRRDPFSGILAGNVTVDLYGLSLPFSFSWSTQERSFSQPFNQFGVSPRYKWITAHLGYRNLTFSPYTLSGHQIFGAGLELTPGDFRASFITGRLRQAVPLDTLDSLNIEEPAFERTGFAGRLGYGADVFSFDLSFLKAQDDTNTLTSAATSSASLRPGENLVVGAAMSLKPVNGLTFKLDGAISDYTRDVRSDSISLSDGAETLGEVIVPRASTQIYTAFRAEMSYYGDAFSTTANYTRVDPDYQSMGAYYTAGDVESISLSPSLRLAKGKMNLTGNFTWAHDNLQDKKLATTQSLSPSLTMNWNPGTKFGLMISASDIISSQSAGRLPINDTTVMDQHTPSITIGPRYMINDTAVSHFFFLTTTHQQLIDNNEFTSRWSEYNTTIANLSWTMTASRAALSLNSSLTGTLVENVAGQQTTWGASVGATKGFLEEKLSVNGSTSASFAEVSRTISVGAGGTFKAGKHHSFNLNLSVSTTDYTENIAGSSFTEYTGTAGYAYRF